MTFEEEDPRPQLNVRVEETIMEKLDSYCDSTGANKIEVVQEALTDRLPGDRGSDRSVPDDDNLREAYMWLLENAGPDGKIEADLALSELAQQFGMSKNLVKKMRFRYLQREKWIHVDNGVITVLERYDRGRGDEQ